MTYRGLINCHGDHDRCNECTSCKDRARSLACKAYPIAQPCEVCGRPNAQRAHYNYAEPLRIRWLCPNHHGAWDAKRRAFERLGKALPCT